jgi:CubicO group peptidase (beta-lactamase class C family)
MFMYIIYLIFIILTVSSCTTTSKKISEPTVPDEKKVDARKEKNETLDKKIDEILRDYNIPAVHAVIIERDEPVYQKISGLRAIEDSQSNIADNDSFYLGKSSKIITALLIAQLIDQKVIRWDSTLNQLIGKDFSINPKLKEITVEMLLAQRSGIVELDKLKVMSTLHQYSTQRARSLVVQSLLSYDPKFTPDTKTDISSANYVILGWILEKYTNFQWEELAKNKILLDVGMDNCSFGLPGNKNPKTIDQPRGHTLNNFKVVSVLPTNVDLPAAVAPAESLSCPAKDFSKLLKEINLGLYRESSLLTEETFSKLFGPTQDPKQTYAHFQVLDRVWAGGRTLTASSQDSFYTSHIVLAPARELILLVMINSGAPKAREGSAKILKILTESVQ